MPDDDAQTDEDVELPRPERRPMPMNEARFLMALFVAFVWSGFTDGRGPHWLVLAPYVGIAVWAVGLGLRAYSQLVWRKTRAKVRRWRGVAV